VDTLEELLSDALRLLERAVWDYHEKGDDVLIPPAAATLRKLCHKTRSQTPLLELLERRDVVVPDFIDGSHDTVGFSIDLGVDRHGRCVGARVAAPIQAVCRLLPWRTWWEESALCLPVDRNTGWQGGRIPVSRERLAVEWTNRYGGAHVDVDGAEQWLLDLIEMRQLGFWADLADDTGKLGAELKWFDDSGPEREWHPLVIRSRALAHLVLVRVAAEVVSAFGRDVPDDFTAMTDDADLPGVARVVRITG
jgi:hypothetical protein